MKAMPLHGQLSLLAWVDRLLKGDRFLLLLASLRLCVLRKEPSWLITMSRPIILEPFLEEERVGCMFRQLMSRSNASGFMPAWAFADWKEFNPLHLVKWIRWMIAGNIDEIKADTDLSLKRVRLTPDQARMTVMAMVLTKWYAVSTVYRPSNSQHRKNAAPLIRVYKATTKLHSGACRKVFLLRRGTPRWAWCTHWTTAPSQRSGNGSGTTTRPGRGAVKPSGNTSPMSTTDAGRWSSPTNGGRMISRTWPTSGGASNGP